MLTPRGIWLLFSVLALTGVALAADVPSLTLVGLTLLLWFVAAWFWFAVRLRLLNGRLHVERLVSDERGPVQSLWAGQAVAVRVRLHNSRRLPSPYLNLRDRVPVGGRCLAGAPDADGSVGQGRPMEIDYCVYCLAPGTLRFEGLAVHVADVQGLFYHYLFLQDVREYRVLPPLADARGHVPTVKRHNLLPLLGAHRHRRPGSGSELLDLREYLPGDPPKTIAWKVSARRDRLMTKVFESEVPVRCTLFVDTSASVRIGSPVDNALTRLVEITAAVAQATAAARDLTGLCLFDEAGTQYLRPARGARHLLSVLGRLTDVAGLPAASARAPVGGVLPLAYGFARETYPQILHADVNAFPVWLPWLFPQPAYTLRLPRWRARSWSGHPLVWLRRFLRRLRLKLRQAVVARLWARHRVAYRWRKQMAALLSVRYGLGPGGLSLLLEDDERCSLYLQRFLADHRVPYQLPLYDAEGRYLFAAPAKVDVLARVLLHAVARGRDNEAFVMLADLLELGDHLGPLLRAVKVALARHHQVTLVCPWPPAMPLPPRHAPGGEPATQADQGLTVGLTNPLAGLIDAATVQRFHRAYHELRRTFGRLGVPVLCARREDPVQLILQRLERLRVHERGVR
jgi:uncharacterized protein (DUF58 family)